MDGANLASRMASADELIQQFTEELNMLESHLNPTGLSLERNITPPSNQTGRPMKSTLINPGATGFSAGPSFGGISPVFPEVPSYQVTPNHHVRPTSVPLGRLNLQPLLQVK